MRLPLNSLFQKPDWMELSFNTGFAVHFSHFCASVILALCSCRPNTDLNLHLSTLYHYQAVSLEHLTIWIPHFSKKPEGYGCILTCFHQKENHLVSSNFYWSEQVQLSRLAKDCHGFCWSPLYCVNYWNSWARILPLSLCSSCGTQGPNFQPCFNFAAKQLDYSDCGSL